MQPTPNADLLSGSLFRGKPPTTALSAQHEVMTEFGSLIVLARGVIDLGLYGLIRQALENQIPLLDEVLIDFSEVDAMTDSGCAALIALDQYAARRYLHMYIVAAPSELRSRARAQCGWLNWID